MSNPQDIANSYDDLTLEFHHINDILSALKEFLGTKAGKYKKERMAITLLKASFMLQDKKSIVKLFKFLNAAMSEINATEALVRTKRESMKDNELMDFLVSKTIERIRSGEAFGKIFDE